MYEVKVASVITVVIRRTFLFLRLLLLVRRHPISDLTSFLICSICAHDQYRRASLQLVSNKISAEDLPSLSILLFTASRSIIWSPRKLMSALSYYERERTFFYFLRILLLYERLSWGLLEPYRASKLCYKLLTSVVKCGYIVSLLSKPFPS